MNTAEPKKPPSVLEQLKKLDEARAKIEEDRAKIEEDRSKILESAKAEVVADIEPLLEKLRVMGYEPILSFGKAKTRTSNPEKSCPICKFRTEPWHDGRWHKTQHTKKPFSDWDLKERRLRKVENGS